jgi:hypothetical protein
MTNHRIDFQVSKRLLWRACGPDHLTFEAPTLGELRHRVEAYVHARHGDTVSPKLMVGGPPLVEIVVAPPTERSAA